MVEEEKNNNKNIKFRAIIIIGALLFSGAVGIFIGRPIYSSLTKTNLEIEKSRAKLTKLETRLGALKKLEARKEELEKNNQLLIRALPESKDVSGLFYQISSIGELTGVKIESIGSADPSAATIANEGSSVDPSIQPIIPVTFSIKANTSSYENVKIFLNKTEEALRMLSIEDLKIRAAEENITLEIKINTYKRS